MCRVMGAFFMFDSPVQSLREVLQMEVFQIWGEPFYLVLSEIPHCVMTSMELRKEWENIMLFIIQWCSWVCGWVCCCWPVGGVCDCWPVINLSFIWHVMTWCHMDENHRTCHFNQTTGIIVTQHKFWVHKATHHNNQHCCEMSLSNVDKVCMPLDSRTTSSGGFPHKVCQMTLVFGQWQS